uniref:Uncharacterized protein n=1 Tax=Oryza glumipatula TaxID=40148 RepID=A0A0D9ZSQ7_9ORYZ
MENTYQSGFVASDNKIQSGFTFTSLSQPATASSHYWGTTTTGGHCPVGQAKREGDGKHGGPTVQRAVL